MARRRESDCLTEQEHEADGRGREVCFKDMVKHSEMNDL